MVRLRSDWLNTVQGMQQEMERLLNYMGSSKPPSVHFARMWEPAVDVYETATEVVVLVELAGVKKDEIQMIVDGRTLVIRGIRQETGMQVKRNFHQMEIHRGPFERSVFLPVTVDPDKTKASYKDGLLEIVLPKVQRARTLRVTITTWDQL